MPVTDLRIPKVGLEHTISIDVGQKVEGFSMAVNRYKLLSEVFLFRKLSPSVVFELFMQCEEETVEPGDVIIHSGEESGIHIDRVLRSIRAQVTVDVSRIFPGVSSGRCVI